MEQREDEMGTYCMEFTREGKKITKTRYKKANPDEEKAQKKQN